MSTQQAGLSHCYKSDISQQMNQCWHQEACRKAVGSFWTWKKTACRGAMITEDADFLLSGSLQCLAAGRAPRQCLRACIQARMCRLSLSWSCPWRYLVSESTAVAAPSHQGWEGNTLNRQSWQAEEVTLTSATAHRSKKELENLVN